MNKGKTYVKNSPVLINASSILYEGGGKTLDKLFDLVYPVGSVYISTNSTSPETLFGGKWTKIEGRFLWATTSTPKTTGGSTTTNDTILTIDQIPSHTHIVQSGDGANGRFMGYARETNPISGSSNYYIKYDGVTANPQRYINNSYTGGGQGHSHTYMPPYFEVYMWYRTA
jgi:hypothetical protein